MISMTISPYVYPGITNQDMFKKLRKEKRSKFSKEEILELVAEKCCVRKEDIIGRVKTTDFVDSRHIFIAIMRKYFRHTYTSIGEFLDRDHTTIIHAIKVFDDRYKNYDYYRQNADRVFNEIKELV